MVLNRFVQTRVFLELETAGESSKERQKMWRKSLHDGEGKLIQLKVDEWERAIKISVNEQLRWPRRRAINFAYRCFPLGAWTGGCSCWMKQLLHWKSLLPHRASFYFLPKTTWQRSNRMSALQFMRKAALQYPKLGWNSSLNWRLKIWLSLESSSRYSYGDVVVVLCHWHDSIVVETAATYWTYPKWSPWQPNLSVLSGGEEESMKEVLLPFLDFLGMRLYIPRRYLPKRRRW